MSGKFVRVAAATLLLASTAMFTPAAADTPPSVLVVASNISDVITLDPAEAFELTTAEVTANVYDHLVQYEPEDLGNLAGGIAESWEFSEDGKTIIFTIRDGLTFHSGNPVTAHDAAYSLHRAIHIAKTPVFIIDQFGWTPDNVADLIVAQDDRTLSMTIVEDFSPAVVLNALTAGVAAIVDSREVMAHEVDGDWGYAWMRTHSAGSGPFRTVTWNANETVVLERFEDYRLGAPAMQRVIYRHVLEPSAQRLLIEQGDVDIARGLTPDQIAGLEGAEGVRVEAFPKATLIYLAVNNAHDTLGNPAVHQAMRHLVDYEGMVGSFLAGQYQVHQSFWPEGMWASHDDNPYALDVDGARAILEEAGLGDGFSITMDTLNESPFLEIAQSIQQTMAEVGIEIEITPAEGSALWPKYRARRHEMILALWGPDYADPHSNADAFARNPDNRDEAQLTGVLAWRNNWVDEGMGAAVEAARMELDVDTRAGMYRDLQATHQAASPFAVLFQKVEQAAMRDIVEGYVSGATADLVFYRNVTK